MQWIVGAAAAKRARSHVDFTSMSVGYQRLRAPFHSWHDLCGTFVGHVPIGGWHEASRVSEIDDRPCGGRRLPAAPAVWSPAKAQARQETLLIVSESGPNNIDIHGVGTNVPGYEVSWNCYDRLISHEMKTLENGTQYYDRDKFKMELADDMNVGDMSVTFKLKKNAVFHDGTPVTAKDVKWSLDRAVTVGGFPTFQMGAGSLSKPEQFVVVDDNTVRVDFLRKDRLTVPDLAVIVPRSTIRSWSRRTPPKKIPGVSNTPSRIPAGSGAYRVVSWNAGTEVIPRAQR
jgi:peptide/nickel transport system substrate-binding protein